MTQQLVERGRHKYSLSVMTQQLVERKGQKHSLSLSLYTHYSWYVEEAEEKTWHYHSTVCRQRGTEISTLIITLQLVEKREQKQSLSLLIYSWYVQEERNPNSQYYSTVGRKRKTEKLTLIITLELVKRGGQKHSLSLSYSI